MSDLKNIFLSKNNIIHNYQNIINKNKLNNLDYNQKTLLTNNLVETMKTTFDKLETNLSFVFLDIKEFSQHYSLIEESKIP
jgi:hypothetical protein